MEGIQGRSRLSLLSALSLSRCRPQGGGCIDSGSGRGSRVLSQTPSQPVARQVWWGPDKSREPLGAESSGGRPSCLVLAQVEEVGRVPAAPPSVPPLLREPGSRLPWVPGGSLLSSHTPAPRSPSGWWALSTGVQLGVSPTRPHSVCWKFRLRPLEGAAFSGCSGDSSLARKLIVSVLVHTFQPFEPPLFLGR